MPKSTDQLEGIPFTREEEYNRTGDWRFSVPILAEDDCIQCDQCVAFCPDDVIIETDSAVEVDYDFCKGCGICAEVCPTDAFTMEDE
jgi:2-oxoacid:acceptor oxidoreductase delta subunit (pyruvate/2-ketoisovalerate family)